MSINHQDVWRLHAKCRGGDTDLWFPPKGRTPSAEALDICSSCPVNVDCLSASLAMPGATTGIFGGAGDSARRRLRRLYQSSPHPGRGPLHECECSFCSAVTEHFARLVVSARVGRSPSPGIRSYGPGASHGRKSTYARGCRGDDCREAMGMKRRGIPCQTSEEAKAG